MQGGGALPGNVAVVDFIDYETSVRLALDEIDAGKLLKSQKRIIVKPNLVDDIAFPVTTHPDTVGVIIDYIRERSDAQIVIAEGCGSSALTTTDIFDSLGYVKLAKDKYVDLIDLNTEPLVRLENFTFEMFPEYYIPETAMNSLIVSVPVLKRHSLSDVTLSLKNMIGFAPPKHYQRGGYWKKSFFHSNIHVAIAEINAYRAPDLTVLDASVGMAEYHLGGKTCDPPVNKIVAGVDPVEVDHIGAGLLKLNPDMIGHIAMSRKLIRRSIE